MISGAEARERLEVLWWCVAAAGLVLGLRLAQLQVFEASEFRLAAERNRTQKIYQTAPRGRVYDRNGDLLATNRLAFSLIFLPGKGRTREDLEPLSRELGRRLGKDPVELMQTLEQAVGDEAAVRLAENLPKATMFQLSELETIYPGVKLITEARRFYPHARFASHLLGYLGKMNAREWRERKAMGYYRSDSWIGKLGLESVFEEELRGRDGEIRMEVDAQGRLSVHSELERVPWEAGSDVHLAIDTAVQKAADEALRRSATGRGAAVAIDPRNGDVLAMSSEPDFDPNALLSTDPEEVLRGAVQMPEFNNAISGVYPPGSTFKPIVALAAFTEGRLKPEDVFYCPGYFQLAKRISLCWNHKGHKKISWPRGLAESCDVYFYNVGLKTGGALMEQYARAFGLGSRTNVALRGEKSGRLAGPETRRKMGGKRWFDGDAVNLAIGQGELAVTPIQMAVVAAAFANRGVIWRPHFTQRIVYPPSDGRREFVQKPEKLGEVRAPDWAWDQVQRGMQEVVESNTGTGGPARVKGLLVAGKTGTAENPHGEDHAWFISYAARPGEPASIAVAVLVENGGHGTTAAAPVARKMILAHFGLPDPEEKAEAPEPVPVSAPRALAPPRALPAGVPR